MRTFIIGSVAVLALLGQVPAATAADVLTRSGPGSADDGVFVTYVGCDAFEGPAEAPQTRLNLGPGGAPMGRRSLGLVPAAPGTGSGPFVRFPSLARVDASVSVASESGTSGVSYVWAITPDVLPGTAWSGRASVAVPATGWHDVAAADLSYEWSLVDLATHRVVGGAGQATTGEFAASHGDGQGYVVTGFGCDGHGFNIDAVRTGAAILDFEGVPLTTTIEVTSEVAAGDAFVVSGSSTDPTGRLTGDPLVLETRAPGGAWKSVAGPLLADASGVTRADLVVREPTEVRWHRLESQYADAGWSDPVTIQPQVPAPGAAGQ